MRSLTELQGNIKSLDCKYGAAAKMCMRVLRKYQWCSCCLMPLGMAIPGFSTMPASYEVSSHAHAFGFGMARSARQAVSLSCSS